MVLTGARRPHVTVLGSANMDVVVVTDRAPERGETVTGREWFTVPGGKGANQAVAAARAGAAVRMLGAVGDDAHGHRIRELLTGDGVDDSGLASVPMPTGSAHIVLDARGENSIIVVPGANGTVTELTDAHRRGISAADVLLLQLELPLPTVVGAARYARSAGVRVLLTPAPAQPLPDELLEAVDVLLPNAGEATAVTGASSVPEAVEAFLAQGVGAVGVTLGERGCHYADARGVALQVPARPVPALDTTAAGDTFAGALAVSLAEGRQPREALEWATAAAALCVQRRGASTSVPHRQEIDALCGQSG